MSCATEVLDSGDTPMNTLDILLQWGPHRGPHPGPHAPMAPTGGTGSGMPWSVWGVGGGLFPTLVGLVLLIVLVVGVVSLLSSRRMREPGDDTDALGVLRRRYARGEIDDEEFERRRGRLDGGPS